MENNLKKLEVLSLAQLIKNSKTLVENERKNIVSLIAHLGELRSRKAFLDLGYNSIFKYCVEELGLDESQAYLRMQVANVCKRVPQVLEMITNKELTLTAAGRISSVLNEDNYKLLLERCKNKKVEEVREIVATYQSKAAFKSGINKSKAKPIFMESPSVVNPAENGVLSNKDYSKNKVEPVNTEKYNFKFSADKKLKEKIDRLAEVLNIQNAAANLPEIIDLAIEIALDKKAPERKEARRQKRIPKEAPTEKANSIKSEKLKNRHISSFKREQTFGRAKYQCEYIATGEKRCSAKTHLEIDHIKPFAQNGTNELDNLQVLCSAHNLHKAKKEYGFKFIEEKVEEQKFILERRRVSLWDCG